MACKGSRVRIPLAPHQRSAFWKTNRNLRFRNSSRRRFCVPPCGTQGEPMAPQLMMVLRFAQVPLRWSLAAPRFLTRLRVLLCQGVLFEGAVDFAVEFSFGCSDGFSSGFASTDLVVDVVGCEAVAGELGDDGGV